MKQAKIHIQEVEKYGKYIERCIQIAYLDQFLLQELLYREVEQANQPQDQKQRDSGVTFLSLWQRRCFSERLYCYDIQQDGSERQKSVDGAVSNKCKPWKLSASVILHSSFARWQLD